MATSPGAPASPPPTPVRTSVARLPAWVAMVAGLVLAAVVVALAWWVLVPRVPVAEVDGVVASAGPGDDVLAGADATFALLCLVAGALLGVAVLVLGRDRVLGAASWAVVGGFAAALAAWQLGRLLGPPSLAQQRAAGIEQLQAPLDLSAPLALALLWPGATAGALFAGLLVWLLVRPPHSLG